MRTGFYVGKDTIWYAPSQWQIVMHPKAYHATTCAIARWHYDIAWRFVRLEQDDWFPTAQHEVEYLQSEGILVSYELIKIARQHLEARDDT